MPWAISEVEGRRREKGGESCVVTFMMIIILVGSSDIAHVSFLPLHFIFSESSLPLPFSKL